MTAIDRIKSVLGPKGWSEDPAEIGPLASDWRGRYQGETPLLVKPASTEEVSNVVAICHEAGIAITPQGGNTGLVGGGTPQGEILLTTRRMNAVRETDIGNDSLTVEAGCVLEAIQHVAADAGRLFPLSLGSQGTATIGGLISTNAGGVHVLRYGMMRDLVLGLEAVLPDGRVWNGLRGLRKDNTGYDLKQMLIGAEGTLGVITAATLKLFPKPGEISVAFTAVDSPEAAVSLLGHMKTATVGALSALELVPRNALELVVQHIPGTRDPFADTHPWYALLEIGAARAGEGREMMEAALGEAFEAGLIRDAVIAESEQQAKDFWNLREPIAEAESDLREKIIRLESVLDPMGLRLWWGATHPFSLWRDQHVTPTERYQNLVMLLQEMARRLVTFGLHVHVGVDSGDKAVMICDRIMQHLPTLLALSCSSPYWGPPVAARIRRRR